MNSWECEGMGLKKTFPFISSPHISGLAVLLSSWIWSCNAVFTCEIQLFQYYFSLHRRPSEIILFQLVETCLILFQNYFRGSWIFKVADVAVELRSCRKRWFLDPRYVGGGNTPDIGHAFSNYNYYFRPYGWIWFSSVQWARRSDGEKREKEERRLNPW